MIKENLAFVFPGQGSQKVGMLAETAEKSPIIEEVFSQASQVLGYDLWAMSQTGPQEELNLTEITQPLLLTASVALWRLWEQHSKIKPKFLTGHSLGEWSALVCAGIIEFSDAVYLVQQRGKYMQSAVPAGVGAMAAIIGLEGQAVKTICEKACEGEDQVAAVNFNSPVQTVIAGTVAGVDKAIKLCQEAQAKRALPLPVSAPFHTELMRPAAEKLEEKINSTSFNKPEIPVIHNVNAQTESDPEKIKALMVEQVYSPVLWVDCVQAMINQGVDTTAECGPGKVLSGLNKKIDRSIKIFSLESPVDMEKFLIEVQ